VQHLFFAVENVLEDGRITDLERDYLQKAVESVLPREQREVAVLRRRERAAEDKKLKAEEKAKQIENERKSRPIAGFDFMVAGVMHEGRATIVRLFANTGNPVYLVRDPQNIYSRNAIEVRLANNEQIGYVPETEAVRLAPILDQGGKQTATIKKIIEGRRALIPVILGEVYSDDSPLPDILTQEQICARLRNRNSPISTGSAPSPEKAALNQKWENLGKATYQPTIAAVSDTQKPRPAISQTAKAIIYMAIKKVALAVGILLLASIVLSVVSRCGTSG